MAFDPSSAQLEGFDPSSAKPMSEETRPERLTRIATKPVLPQDVPATDPSLADSAPAQPARPRTGSVMDSYTPDPAAANESMGGGSPIRADAARIAEAQIISGQMPEPGSWKEALVPRALEKRASFDPNSATPLLESITKLAKIPPEGSSFEMQKEFNREYLRQNSAAVVDYLQRDKNLAPEDARAEYDKMLKHGVVPRARVENARGEASYGDVLAVGAKRAWLEFGRASAGMGQWAGEVFGAPGIEKFYGDLASGDEKRIARAASGVVGKIPEEGFKALLAENAPSIIGQLPAALAAGLAAGISKNPAPIIEMFTTLTLSQMGAQKFGTSYLEGKAAGLSLGDNTVQSIVKTVSEVLPEKLSLEAFFKIVGARGVREMGLAFLRQQTMEHTTEQITTALDALTDKAYATPGMTVGDYLKQVADTFKGTALQAPLLGAAGATGNVVGKAATTPWTQAGRFGRDLGQLVDGASFDPAAMDWVVRESFDPEAATLASRGITPISEFPGIQNVSNRNAPAPAATPETGPQDGPSNAAGDAGDGVSGGTQRGGGVGAPSGTSLEGSQHAEATGRGDAAGAVEGDALDQEILALEQRALDPATYTPQVSAMEEIPVAVPGVRPYTREDLANVHAVAQAELGDRYSPSDIKLVRPEALPDTLSPGQQGPRLTRSAAAFMGAIAEAGGRQVVFFDSPTRRVASGGAYVTGNQNAIYLNVRGEINAATEAFHEAAHMLQDSDPGAYAELVASLDAATQDGRTVLDTSDGALLNFAWEYYGVRPDEVGGDLNQMLDRVGTTRNRLKDEMVADAVGVATRQKEFWPKLFMELGRRDIGALRKIHRVLRAVSAEVKRALTKGPTFSQIQRYINDMDVLVSASSKALAKLATTPAAGKGVSGAHKNVVYSQDRIGPFASRGSAETTARWNATRNQFYDIVNTDSGIFLVKRGQNESGRSAEEPITGAGPGRVDQGKPAAATQPGSQVARSGGSSVPGSTGGGRGPGSDLRVSVRPEEAPSFGEPGKPGAVKVFGVHYSRGERSTLSGSYYGKGLRGAEARRLEGAPAELRNRAYFYIDEGSGTEAESGVGAFPHAVNLDGIYDVVADPEGLWAGQKDANSREMAVLEAGYTGYYHPGIFGSQGVAVVLNPKTEIPVLYAGATGSRTVPVKEVKPSAKRTIEKENKVSVVVGGKPGEFGWNLAARVAAARIDAKEREAKLAPAVARPPFLAPVHEKPNFAQMGAAVRKVLSAKGARDVIKEITGAEVSSVEQVLGSWEGKAEPSFVLSGSITFEQAQDVGNLLGVLFSQDATVVTQPWHGESDDQIPAVYIGQNKPMSPGQIAQVVATAKKEGIDFSTTTDGHGVKFLHFGDAAEYDILRGKIAKVAEAASLPDIKSYYVRSSLNENQDYLSGRVGRLFQGEGDPTRTPGRSDLFRRAVDHVLVPYAKAAGAQGYRFDPALFGERFGLTQDQTDYVRAALRPKNGKAISSVPIASGAEVLDPPRNNVRLKEPGVTKNDLLWALQNRVAQAGLISPTDHSEEAKKILAQAIADEVKWNVEQPGGKSAVGWYDAALHKAKSIYEEVFPELRNNPDQEMMFDAVLGITSQGNDVHSNAVFAGRIYHLMTREGMSIPEVAQVLRGTFGKQTVAIEQNLAKLDTLLRAMGLAKARAFFNTSTTVEGLRATIRNDLALRTLDGKPLVVSGVGPQKVTGWAVFGPKIGSFINNLHGDYSTLTADLWFSRTWNRLLGHAFLYNPDLATAQYVSLYRAMLQEVETGEGRDVVGLRPQDIEDLADSPEAMLTFARDTDIRREAEFKTLRKEAVTPLRQAATNLIRNTGDTVETPRSDSERYFQQQVVEEAQKELKGKAGIDISVADIQAVLWYHEKKLFSKYGVGDSKAEAADYADAARRFVTRFREGDLFYVEKPKPRYIIGTKGDYLNQGKVSLSRSRLGFFSPLSEAVAKARIEIQPATQWVLWLHSNAAKLGIKADEMKWSGVLDWLDTKGREKLTRDDVSRFLAEGGVKVSEVKYDEDPEAEVEDGYGASGRETSYSGYAMPGGMNYREVLLTYPQVTPTFDVYQTTRFSVFESSKSSKYHLVMGLNPQGFATREDAKKALEDLAAEDPSVSIKDAHIVDRGPSMERIGKGFESKAVAEDLIARNPGSYLRPGKPSAKVLFKSDHWKDPNVLAHLRLAEHIGPSGERVLFVEEVQSDWGQHVAKHGFDSPAVGQAPFISSTQGWTALALKRAIAIAVNERFDKVAFINGAQSAERYDLSEKVDRIEYVKTGPGEWSFGARNKKGEEILSRAGLSRGDLEAYLGKSIAEKITDDGGSREPGEPEGYGVVSGGDLKVGGEGMVAYYDKILPQVLSGILKKAGSRLSSMTLEFHGVDSEGKAKVTSGKQLAFDVTPEMRQAVGQQGLPLFSPARAQTAITGQSRLTAEEKQVEDHFWGLINKDPQRAIDAYLARYPDTLDTDQARELSPHYVEDPTRWARAVHEPASELVKMAYARHLESLPRGSTVLFTGGGGGSGKGYALTAIPRLREDSSLIYNTTLAGYESAKKKIDQALDAGMKVSVAYVYRPPLEALKGAVDRGNRIGRTVPLTSLADAHSKAPATVLALRAQYKGNPNVEFKRLNNVGEKPLLGSFDDLPTPEYNTLLEDFKDAIDHYYQAGRISPAARDSYLKGARGPEQSSVGVPQSAPGDVPGSVRGNAGPGKGASGQAGGSLAVAASPARARVTKAVQPTFSVEEPGRWDNIVYELQDKLVDVKRVREAIKAQGRAVKDQFDPYLAEETYHGRAAWRGQVFLDSEVAPLMTAMKSYAISIQGLEEYLHARHAQERNAAMAAINPGMANDALSGMSDADAQAVLARINASPKAPAFKALAARVDAITEGTRNLLVASGLETQATINDWRGAYKHYVPLQRDMGDADPATGNGTGQGFSVSGAASRRATGSNRPVEHILSNLVMQRERAITRAEKNRVAKALYGMVLENPAQGFWGAIHPGMSLAQVQAELQSLGVDPALSQALLAVPVTRTVNPSTGLVEERVNPLYKRMENVVLVRINGMDRAIVMSPSSARAMRLAESFKNLDVNTLHGVLTRIGAVTRYISAINTQYNPVFGFTNFARDIQGAAINLSSTPLAGKQLGLLLRALPAMRRIWVSERSGNIDPGYREFMEEGGQTGYKDMFAGPEDRAAALQAMIDPRWWEKAKPLNYVLSLLSDYNTAIENSVRLAAYQEARKAGMSKVQAASLAKNLTVNFNRKGRSGREANSLYAFFNAAVQGTARIGESMAGPAGRRILAAGVSLGVLQAVVGIAALGDGWDDLPDFEKDRNLIFPIPGAQKYAKVPMPLGLHVIPSLARKIVEVAYFKGRTGERVASMLGLVLDAFNPLGSGSFLDMALPSFLDPVAQLYANTDPFGRPIYKEDRSSLAPTPGFSRVKDTASAPARALAKAANSVTGGDEYEPGAWSPTPDQIDFVFGQITGGLGREVNKAFQAMTSSKDLPPHKIPLVGRFYGALDSSTGTKARYFRDLKELSSYELGVKGRAKDGKDVEAYLEANPKARLFAMGDATALAISKLEKYKRGLQDKEEVKAVDDQILGLMRSLSEAMALEDQATVK